MPEHQINPNVPGRGQLVSQINAELKAIWQRINENATAFTQMAATVERLARVTITSGQAPVPAMALPGTQSVTVNLKNAMPDDAYSATATLAGGVNLLSALTVVGITAQTATTVTVQVRCTGVLSAGAIVAVHAVRHS
ncbi:hypothetical protein [Micromonospora sp. NPDC023956]|uniref:hypothetical protein n=1 Tax=Micromonospora sp. NPDC023956 TaxID=3155722 RepID=UPI003410D03A